MTVPLSFQERLNRKLPRLTKSARQWSRALASGERPATRFVFVVGSQRSGTRLPLQIMDYAPEIATFAEGADPFFNGVLLEPIARIRELALVSPFPVIALKPICETHRVVELLDTFPGSKAIWIFRHFEDAVSSASLKWTSGREAVRRLAHGELEAAGWRAGGLTPERLALVRRLYRDDMSLHEANAVMWILRNGLFFDLDAGSRADLLLVRYEDLVAQPQVAFSRMFDFIDVEIPDGFADGIRESAGSRRQSFPPMAAEIREHCERLLARLIDHYAMQLPPAKTPVTEEVRP